MSWTDDELDLALRDLRDEELPAGAAEAVRAHALGFTWEANTAALYDHLAGLVAARQARG